MLEPETLPTTTDQADLDAFLIERGCSPELKKGLHISPAPEGSGYSDTSAHHDQALLEQQTEPHSKNNP